VQQRKGDRKVAFFTSLVLIGPDNQAVGPWGWEQRSSSAGLHLWSSSASAIFCLTKSPMRKMMALGYA